MTNGWIDIKNTDMMLIMGGNPAENHPCGFKWAIEAKIHRNAKTIVVDPRLTRTAANADMYVQIRAGSDIAFLGGVINYAIANNRIAHEYLVNYTNAAFIIKDGFKLPEDGLYSGFDAEKQTYDKKTWNYEEGGDLSGKAVTASPAEKAAAPLPVGATAPPPLLPPKTAYDLTLQHPRCVFQLMKKQYERYTPEMVERITGIPQAEFLRAADLYTSVRKDGDMKKASTIIYAVGWTQHSFGTQIIRTAAMLQLLMGNIGRAGGGVNALRGHSNIQGATDMAGIFDNLPGYLKVPNPNDVDLATYLKRVTPTPSKPDPWDSFNYYSNTPKFVVSLLKAMYGPAATKENDFAFNYLPKIDRNYSWVNIWNDMYEGKIKGVFAFGMNGVMIGPDSNKNIEALKKADWLVVCEIYPDETSEFWRAPGITAEDQKKNQHHRVPPAGRWFRRERRNVRKFRALAAMEERSRATSGRVPPRSGNSGDNFPQDPRVVSEGRWQVPRSRAERHVPVHESLQPVIVGSSERAQWQGAGGHHRSQDKCNHQSRPAASRFRLVER